MTFLDKHPFPMKLKNAVAFLPRRMMKVNI